MTIDKGFDELREILVQKRQALVERLAASNKKARENSEFEGDDADKAFSAEFREMTFAMGTRERHEIKAIEGALKSINDGVYGSCDECSKKIAKKRLKILPFTRYCMDCQAELELEKKQAAQFMST